MGVYDWNKDKIVDERSGLESVKALGVSSSLISRNDRILAACGEFGEVSLFKAS